MAFQVLISWYRIRAPEGGETTSKQIISCCLVPTWARAASAQTAPKAPLPHILPVQLWHLVPSRSCAGSLSTLQGVGLWGSGLQEGRGHGERLCKSSHFLIPWPQKFVSVHIWHWRGEWGEYSLIASIYTSCRSYYLSVCCFMKLSGSFLKAICSFWFISVISSW